MQIDQERLLHTFFDLVRVDSQTGNEADIAAFIKTKCANMPVKIQEDDAARLTGLGANNLIITYQPQSQQKPDIFFAAHMDTVDPGHAVTPVINEDVITSSGATILGADDKAGIACMLEAFHILTDNHRQDVCFQCVITVGEETGFKGVKVLGSSLLTAETGYVLDGEGDVGVIYSQSSSKAVLKAKLWPQLEKGTSSLSAVKLAARLIKELPLGLFADQTVVSVAQFQGKSMDANHHEAVFVDLFIQAHTPKTLQTYITYIITLSQDIMRRHHGQVEIDHDILHPAYKWSMDDVVVYRAVEAMEGIGIQPVLTVDYHGSDANYFNDHGLPTVNLAVGYENIHTTSERIRLSALVRSTRLLLAIVDQPT